MSRRTAPKMKRSIPGTQGMWCISCRAPNAEGRLDSGGRPFIGCSTCRSIHFGLNAAAIWFWKSVSMTFNSAAFRESIREKAAAFQEESLAGGFMPPTFIAQAPPQAEPVAAPGPEPVPVPAQEGAAAQ